MLRIVAWVMFLSGLVGTTALGGTTEYFRAQGHEVGPDHVATWPSGQNALLLRPRFSDAESLHPSNECTVTPDAGAPRKEDLPWGGVIQRDFAGTATITCEDPATLVTGTGAQVLNTTYGPIILIPLAMVFIGFALLLPRLVTAMGRFSIGGRLGLRAYRRHQRRRDRLGS